MNVLEKIVDKLIDKGWFVFCVSVILGFASAWIFPDDFAERCFRFENPDWNTLAFLLIRCMVAFVILYVIKKVANKISTAIRTANEVAEQTRLNEAYKARDMEETKSFIDSLSDLEYSIIDFLIENENKNPYKEKVNLSRYILGNRSWFVASPYVELSTMAGSLHQYLLTNQKYYELKEIIEKTGSLTHFKRKRVKI